MSDKKESNELPKSIVGFLDKHGTKLWNGVKHYYKKSKNEARSNWRWGHEHYLDKARKKYYFAKTFLTYNEPRPLYDLYVPLSVACGNNIKDEVSINDLLEVNHYSIIMATGGSGKTMMMRHLFVDSIENTSKVPIFVELRELNNRDLTLFDLIKKKLEDNEFNFGDDYLEIALKAGHFTLLLDGFDEIIDAKRDETITQINEIADKYEKNNIILSSRPDESLNRWTLFNIWQVQPLTLKQACKLVRKTEVDKDIKLNFIRALVHELFSKHKSFLANPLLLAIMLITYKDNANIPKKISTFYERAYTALFEQHDAKKAFHRIKRSNLDILEFKRVFSVFCLLTYNNNLYNFQQSEVYEYLEKSQKITGITFSKKHFLHDSLQAICLLTRDGLDITFSHRSFQEYFAAFFVTQMSKSKARQKFIRNQLMESYGDGSLGAFLDMSFELSPEVIETDLLIPQLTQIENQVGYTKKFGKQEYKNFINLIYRSAELDYLEFNDDEIKEKLTVGLYPRISTYNTIISFIESNYIKSIEKYYNTNSLFPDEFNQMFIQRYEVNSNIPIEEILDNEELFKAFSKLPWQSKEKYKLIIELKNILIEKHKKRESFLEEEILYR